jgi:hypothetical protein
VISPDAGLDRPATRPSTSDRRAAAATAKDTRAPRNARTQILRHACILPPESLPEG